MSTSLKDRNVCSVMVKNILKSVFHAEYDSGTEDVMVVLLTDDKEIREIYEKASPLYASAPIFKKHLPLFHFTVVLSPKPIESVSKILVDKVLDLETAKRLIPC